MQTLHHDLTQISRHPRTSSAKKKNGGGKEYLNLTWGDMAWPLAFMLSASLTGLRFPLGYLGLLIVLVNRFKNDRYDFVIQFTLFAGGYSLLLPWSDLFFPYFSHVIFLVSVALLALFRKNMIMKKVSLLFAAYAAILIIFAKMSDESLRVQFLGITTWLGFVFFMIPLAAFSGKEFDMKVFFRKLFPYLFIFCAYYILDGLVFCGNVLLPRDASALFYESWSFFWDLKWAPMSFSPIRVWPQGLYIMILCIYPICKVYRLTWWQWAMIALALYVDKTFTFLAGLMVCFVVVQGSVKRMLKYFVIVSAVFTGLYFLDSDVQYNEDSGYQSTLRIKSTIRQFTELDGAQFDEDFAELGSDRMAQVIPKMQHLYKLGREWVGFGFLSRSNTTNRKYIIDNDLYKNPEMSEEVATGVEVVPVQIVLTIGYIGLILHVLVYIGFWFIVRKYKYSLYFLSVLIAFAVIGIGGFSGWIALQGLYLCALAYAAVILHNRREMGGFDMPRLRRRQTDQISRIS